MLNVKIRGIGYHHAGNYKLREQRLRVKVESRGTNVFERSHKKAWFGQG